MDTNVKLSIMRDGTPIPRRRSEHLNRLDIRAVTFPENITDDELCTQMVNSLGKDYEEKVEHYCTIRDDPSIPNYSLKVLKSQLLSWVASVGKRKANSDSKKKADDKKGGAKN